MSPVELASDTPSQCVAVLIPCRNEEATVATVVSAFRQALPQARVYVFDNNSDDRTRELAAAAGAIVGVEQLQGKGHVVRRMFADIDAEVYVLVDGDDTYSAPSAPELVRRLVVGQLDMVNAARRATGTEAYRPGHRFGNVMLSSLVRLVFGARIQDLLSGYRVFSRRFVKSFPASSAGFELETEFTVHALELQMPIAEIETPYKERPAGSQSKLRTFRDGLRILRTIIDLAKLERPLAFFSGVAAVLALTALILAVPVLREFRDTGLVPRFPTAILATGLMIIAALTGSVGLVLDSVAHGRREAKRLAYLRYPPPGALLAGDSRARVDREHRL